MVMCSMTLLNYIIDLIERNYPQALNVDAELDQVAAARRINMGETAKDVASLKKVTF